MVSLEMLQCQIDALPNTSKELMISGSAGSGKTTFACIKVLFYALEHPNSSIYCYRITMPSLKRTVIKEMRQLLWKLQVPYDENKTEGVMEFTNGSRIFFGALDEIGKVRSINADVIYIEQAEELTSEEFYVELMLRLGRGEASKQENSFAQMIVVVQPQSKSHWLYEHYFEFKDAVPQYDDNGDMVKSREEVVEELRSQREVVHFSYLDNYYLPKANRDYYNHLKDVDPQLYERYSLGEWNNLTNVIFPNFDTVVTVTEFDFYTCGVDFGFNHPSVCLLIGWKDDEAFILDEVYVKETLNKEFIQLCRDMLFSYKLLPEHLEYCICDAANPDKIEEFRQAGFPAIGGVKDVTAKIQTTKQTRLHISPSCENTIKEIHAYKWKIDPKTGKVLDEPVKVMDDAMDAMMYCVYGVRGNLSPNRIFSEGNNVFNRIKVY